MTTMDYRTYLRDTCRMGFRDYLAKAYPKNPGSRGGHGEWVEAQRGPHKGQSRWRYGLPKVGKLWGKHIQSPTLVARARYFYHKHQTHIPMEIDGAVPVVEVERIRQAIAELPEELRALIKAANYRVFLHDRDIDALFPQYAKQGTRTLGMRYQGIAHVFKVAYDTNEGAYAAIHELGHVLDEACGYVDSRREHHVRSSERDFDLLFQDTVAHRLLDPTFSDNTKELFAYSFLFQYAWKYQQDLQVPLRVAAPYIAGFWETLQAEWSNRLGKYR